MDESKLSQLDGIDAARWVNSIGRAASNPTTDGFTQCTCKHQLYLLKCLIEDVYKDLPEFPEQEKQWEQQRIIELLKRN